MCQSPVRKRCRGICPNFVCPSILALAALSVCITYADDSGGGVNVYTVPDASWPVPGPPGYGIAIHAVSNPQLEVHYDGFNITGVDGVRMFVCMGCMSMAQLSGPPSKVTRLSCWQRRCVKQRLCQQQARQAPTDQPAWQPSMGLRGSGSWAWPCLPGTCMACVRPSQPLWSLQPRIHTCAGRARPEADAASASVFTGAAAGTAVLHTVLVVATAIGGGGPWPPTARAHAAVLRCERCRRQSSTSRHRRSESRLRTQCSRTCASR